MGATIHYNPSSGAVSYYATNGAVQVIEEAGPGTPCSACGIYDTPSEVSLTFSGISYVNNGTCYFCDVKWSGMFDPNTTYTLTQDPSSPCIWKQTLSVNVTVTEYNSTDASCSGGIANIITGTSVTVYLRLFNLTDFYPYHVWMTFDDQPWDVIAEGGALATFGGGKCVKSGISIIDFNNLGCKSGGRYKLSSGGSFSLDEV